MLIFYRLTAFKIIKVHLNIIRVHNSIINVQRTIIKVHKHLYFSYFPGKIIKKLFMIPPVFDYKLNYYKSPI